MSAEVSQAHPGELRLRRLRAGELPADEARALEAHAAECPACRARLRGLDDEQQRFEEAVSFERFSAGVLRASRERPRVAAPRGLWAYPLVAAAAAAVLVVLSPRLVAQFEAPAHNRLKGGAQMSLRIAAAGGGAQREASAAAPERLSPGERVRIGYQSGGHRWVLAASIDAQGAVTPIYPERGQSLPAEPGGEHYLPGALEFTGHGPERVIVILSDAPVQVDQVEAAAKRAFRDAGGELSRLPPLGVPGEQLHRTVLKP